MTRWGSTTSTSTNYFNYYINNTQDGKPVLTEEDEMLRLLNYYRDNRESKDLLCFKGRPDGISWARIDNPRFKGRIASTWLYRLIPKEAYMEYKSYSENYQYYEDKIYIKESSWDLDDTKTIEVIDCMDTFITLYEKGAMFKLLHNVGSIGSKKEMQFRKEDVQLQIGPLKSLKAKRRKK